MIPVDESSGSLAAVEAFYDRLAPDYDAMTDFDKRFVREKPFFRLLVDKFHIATALDAGAGTGFHSILLARLGLSVTAADISGDMLAILERHAGEQGVSVRTVRSPFSKLRDHLDTRFDAIFCMGNSLAHLLSEEELRDSLAAFHGLLKPRAVLFLQIINYDRVLASKEKIQSVREIGGRVYTRSYSYRDRFIDFQIMRHDAGSPETSSQQTVTLRPILQEEMLPALRNVGFASAEAFGSIRMDKYVKETSQDLVVLARAHD